MNSSSGRQAQEDLLAQLAQLLDCDVSDFMPGAKTPDELGDTAELLRLWLAMPSSEGRQELLEHARRLAKN